jgi:AcrR family transcriptional regulator
MARLKREHRNKQILLAAYEIASNKGLYEITLVATAKRVNCSHGTVLHYYKSAIGLRDAVIKEAIRRKDLKIIGEAVLSSDPAVEEVLGPVACQAVNVYVGTQMDA